MRQRNLLPNHKTWNHYLWTTYFLIQGFTLPYTLHHMCFQVFTLLQ